MHYGENLQLVVVKILAAIRIEIIQETMHSFNICHEKWALFFSFVHMNHGCAKTIFNYDLRFKFKSFSPYFILKYATV